ncbi:MAG: hypothetical protein HRT61_20690 [Ekhidna sp.]|nr:hypothetical protein [Ekhidna sp.]
MKEIKEGDKVRVTGDKLGHGLEIGTIAVILGPKDDEIFFIKVGNGTYSVSRSNVETLEQPEPKQDSDEERFSKSLTSPKTAKSFEVLAWVFDRRIAALKKEVEQMKKERAKVDGVPENPEDITPPKKPKRWRAKHGDEYYYTKLSGLVNRARDLGYSVDHFNYNQRNYFQTRDEADQYVEKLKTISEIRNRIEELNDGWEPCFDGESLNYYMLVQDGIIRYNVDRKNQYQQSWKYMRDLSVYLTLKEEFGDRLKVLFE